MKSLSLRGMAGRPKRTTDCGTFTVSESSAPEDVAPETIRCLFDLVVSGTPGGFTVVAQDAAGGSMTARVDVAERPRCVRDRVTIRLTRRHQDEATHRSPHQVIATLENEISLACWSPWTS